MRWQPERVITIGQLRLEDLRLVIGALDRSEPVAGEFEVVGGRLAERPVTMSEIPALEPEGDGPHTVASKVRFCASVVAEHDGVVFGAFDGARPAGVAAVAPAFEPPLAWFAYLLVHRADRRRGVASALWDACAAAAREGGAERLYVSAIPTASAVGFYLSRGCRLAEPVHPALFELEPDDVHLVADLAPAAP